MHFECDSTTRRVISTYALRVQQSATGKLWAHRERIAGSSARHVLTTSCRPFRLPFVVPCPRSMAGWVQNKNHHRCSIYECVKHNELLRKRACPVPFRARTDEKSNAPTRMGGRVSGIGEIYQTGCIETM